MKHFLLPLVLATLFLAAPSQAGSILVGQCVEFDACWNGPTPIPWSDTLSLADLTTLGLGNTIGLKAVQTSTVAMVLGVTTLTFTTSSGDVVDTINAFSGGPTYGTCHDCAVYVIGEFVIPNNATALSISGTFGGLNGSAGMNLFLDSDLCECTFPPDPVPEPSTSSTVGASILALGSLAGLRRWLERSRSS